MTLIKVSFTHKGCDMHEQSYDVLPISNYLWINIFDHINLFYFFFSCFFKFQNSYSFNRFPKTFPHFSGFCKIKNQKNWIYTKLLFFKLILFLFFMTDPFLDDLLFCLFNYIFLICSLFESTVVEKVFFSFVTSDTVGF